MSNKKELKEHVMLSLTPTEKQDLRDIAKCMLGNENMSQMVGYWINKYKDEAPIVSDVITIGEMDVTKEDFERIRDYVQGEDYINQTK
jgi:hypothetical protein